MKGTALSPPCLPWRLEPLGRCRAYNVSVSVYCKCVGGVFEISLVPNL